MPDPGGRLLRVLGVGFGLAVIIGNTVGAGILRAPGEVAAHLPQPGLFLAAWLAGGLYSLIGAFQIAELGTMLPRSGAHYVFTHHALGDYPGFVVGWSDWLATCGTAAAVSIVIAEFSAPFERASEVVIDGKLWSCAGTACTARGDDPRPAIACRKVARKLGPVTRFVTPRSELDAAALSACNQNRG